MSRFVVQRGLVGPREPLDDVHLVGVRVAEVVQPRRFTEADDVDDEGVAFPTTD